MRWFLLVGAFLAVLVEGPSGVSTPVPAAPVTVPHSDYFNYPLPTWEPHCLGFGSEWRLCNGTVPRACSSGAIWLHTGVDIKTGSQPVMAAADRVNGRYTSRPNIRRGWYLAPSPR